MGYATNGDLKKSSFKPPSTSPLPSLPPPLPPPSLPCSVLVFRPLQPEADTGLYSRLFSERTLEHLKGQRFNGLSQVDHVAAFNHALRVRPSLLPFLPPSPLPPSLPSFLLPSLCFSFFPPSLLLLSSRFLLLNPEPPTSSLTPSDSPPSLPPSSPSSPPLPPDHHGRDREHHRLRRLSLPFLFLPLGSLPGGLVLLAPPT